MRQRCIQCLLTSAPEIVAPVMTWLLYESDTLCLSTRMEILDELMTGAYSLAAIQPPESDRLSNTSAVVSSRRLESYNSSESMEIADGDGTDSAPYLGLVSNYNSRKLRSRLPTVGHSTIVKRPNYLRKKLESNVIIRNNFTPVANLFFFPVLRVLLKGQGTANWRSARVPGDEVDGLRALLPSHALRALSVFVRCASNTPLHGYEQKCIRKFIHLPPINVRLIYLLWFAEFLRPSCFEFHCR